MNSQFRWMVIALVAILLIALGPILSAAISSGIANALGCQLDEGNPRPCSFAGFEISELLYGMFVTAWLSLVTLPFGALALLIWAVAALVMYVRRKRASS